jgi:hypothetical protein
MVEAPICAVFTPTAQDGMTMSGGVTVIPGVYIFVDTVNFLKISFSHIVGKHTKWHLWKHISIYGYIGIY